MKKFLILIIATICLSGCSSSKDNYKYSSDPKIESLMTNNNYIILDVRTKEEYNESHVSGALNIPYNEIDENINIDKNSLILVYCKSGTRANIAKQTLINLGYNVYNLGAFSKLDLKKE